MTARFLSTTAYQPGTPMQINSTLYRVTRCVQRPHEALYDVYIELVRLRDGRPVTNRRGRRAYRKEGRKK